MKRRKLMTISFLLVLNFLILCFALIGCSKQPHIEQYSDFSYAEKFENIYDVIEHAQHVVIGKISDAEKYDTYGSKFVFQIDGILKGNIDSGQIDVYESSELLEIDKKYMLFLGEFDHPVYPDTVYTSIVKECILEIDGNNFASNIFFDEKYEKDFNKLLNDIKKSKEIKMKVEPKKEKVANQYKNAEELNLNSEIIIQAKIIEIHEVNKYANRVKVEVLENLKGDFDSEQYLYLPSSVEMSGEYLMFLNNINNQFELSSRKSSIISADDIKVFENTYNEVKSLN